MRITEFDRFCLSHACAEHCRDSKYFCPLADTVRERTGSYPSPPVCERIYNEIHPGGEKHERAHHDPAKRGRS